MKRHAMFIFCLFIVSVGYAQKIKPPQVYHGWDTIGYEEKINRVIDFISVSNQTRMNYWNRFPSKEIATRRYNRQLDELVFMSEALVKDYIKSTSLGYIYALDWFFVSSWGLVASERLFPISGNLSTWLSTHKFEPYEAANLQRLSFMHGQRLLYFVSAEISAENLERYNTNYNNTKMDMHYFINYSSLDSETDYVNSMFILFHNKNNIQTHIKNNISIKFAHKTLKTNQTHKGLNLHLLLQVSGDKHGDTYGKLKMGFVALNGYLTETPDVVQDFMKFDRNLKED